MVIAAIFTIVCLGISITGFASLGEISDATQAADAKGYALFWAFLACVAMTFGVLAWWMAYAQRNGEDT
jgi:hypothetical protein